MFNLTNFETVRVARYLFDVSERYIVETVFELKIIENFQFMYSLAGNIFFILFRILEGILIIFLGFLLLRFYYEKVEL